MDPAALKELLERVRSGETEPDAAVTELRDLPFAELGYAMVDHHRALRQGVPEVVFGQGKTAAQVAGIMGELGRRGGNVLVTRVDAGQAADVRALVPAARYAPVARTLTLEQAPIPRLSTGRVALVSAGTSDLPVAEECAETLRMLGVEVDRVIDVGVSGIHRLLHKRSVLEAAAVVVVVAGMEGALPSVVGGLVDGAVVSVPTSIGYGANFQGLSALLCMLTSCASGITVVNIDNGFGGAFAAVRILRSAKKVGAP
ncbi:MAG: nickel pincer cofactor biosynthesis protein LarB [Myxococcales bacterium]|nr:nickel pincer cofactor biosynthesis protein LarB [Myxococcales bacterium]MBL0198210.1 nickel pincer cofactor biosynthesis protein LarB [Myxococcales bacterium]